MSRHRLATAGAFAVQGMLLISLTTRLPTLQDRWGVDETQLSLVLLGMILLAGVGSLTAEKVAAVRPSATVLRVGLVGVATGFAIICLSENFTLSLLGMAIYGAGLGTVDACGNMQAVAVEHLYRRPILPSFHGAWTAGGALGAAIALTGLPLPAVAALGLVPLALSAAPFLPRATAVTPAGAIDVPWRPIVLVGIAMAIFYTVDTASQTWGPLYLDDTFHTEQRWVALAIFPYLVAMLATRLAGDRLVHRFGPVPVIRVGVVIAVAALATVVFAPTWPVAVVGFAFLGAGLAVVAPLSFSAAARIASVGNELDLARTDAVIARLNQFNYAGALVGSVLTGLIGAGNLRIGFAVPMVLVGAIIPLASQFAATGPGQTGSAHRPGG